MVLFKLTFEFEFVLSFLINFIYYYFFTLFSGIFIPGIFLVTSSIDGRSLAVLLKKSSIEFCYY